MITIKNNQIYVKIDGYRFNEKQGAYKQLGLRWNPVLELWYGPLSLYDEAWQIDHECAFTKAEMDEADRWFKSWWTQFSVMF